MSLPQSRVHRVIGGTGVPRKSVSAARVPPAPQERGSGLGRSPFLVKLGPSFYFSLKLAVRDESSFVVTVTA
jgi:hypothetical protein